MMSFCLPVNTAGIRLPRSLTQIFPVGEKGLTNVWIYKHAWIYKQLLAVALQISL